MLHLLHPTGNTFVRALLEGLEQSGADYRFWTTIAVSPGIAARLLPKPLRSQLARRSFPIPRSRVESRPWREWVRLLGPALGLGALTRHETGWASVDAVYRDLDGSLARHLCSLPSPNGADWVYAYEDGALESFRAAKEQGIRRAYELPIAYWETSRRLLEEEAARWPDWADTLVGPADSPEKLERKTRELELADVIVVPSQFVKRSLPSWLRPEQRVVVAEFGSPQNQEAESGNLKAEIGRTKTETGPLASDLRLAASGPPSPVPRPPSPKLRVLFAGSMSQRKGLADVFAAMRLLNRPDVELVIMGSPVKPLVFYHEQGVPFTYEPPRPHTEVLKLMETCDVLLLPSIVEGRALVQQEALAMGLPIVVTPNAGGEDLVLEGKTGFLVPIRKTDTIAERLSWLADHRNELEAMRPACREMAARYTWNRYSGIILAALGIGCQ